MRLLCVAVVGFSVIDTAAARRHHGAGLAPERVGRRPVKGATRWWQAHDFLLVLVLMLVLMLVLVVVVAGDVIWWVKVTSGGSGGGFGMAGDVKTGQDWCAGRDRGGRSWHVRPDKHLRVGV
jgi:ABC-type Fe3+ transport system permease subunit